MIAVLFIAVALGLTWAVGSAVLRLAAWVLVATMAISLVGHVEIPPGIPFVAVGCWLAGHGLFRLKHRYWRSQLLQRLADRRLAAVELPSD